MTQSVNRTIAVIAVSAATGLLAFMIVVWPRCNAAPSTGTSRGMGQAPGIAKAVLDAPPVQVRVTKLITGPSNVLYRYEVVNGGAFPISGLSIGNDFHLDNTELDAAPVGWDGDANPQTPSSSVRSPPGWAFEFISTEGGEPGTADWKASGPSETIQGGMSISGFALVLPQESTPYEQGHWTVYLDTNDEILYSGALQPSGVTSVPVSSVFAKSDLTVKPNPARDVVKIQFAVPVAGLSIVEVFDAQGRLIRKVFREQVGAKLASVTWDGRNEAGKKAAAGIYFVRVKTPTTQRFARVTLLR